MKILIAPASFKGSIISKDISSAIVRGIRKIKKNIVVKESPIADGGMGTLDIITRHFKGKYITCYVTNPLGKKIKTKFGIIQNKKLAIIELAQAAGLHLIPEQLKNPLKTTTIGVGDLIKESIRMGSKKIIIGVGDSGTIDCGIGALSVLGVKFLDRNSKPVELTCSGLLKLKKIDATAVNSLKKSVEFIILADVANPLTGKKGAIVYAPQKGAKDEDLPLIARALKNFKKIIFNQYKIDLDRIRGTGAAGGIAGGMYAILNAKIVSGFDYFEKIFNQDKKVKNADLVVTGEGKIDKTTFSGKATGRIINLCKKYRKPVIIVCGDYDRNLDLRKYGVIKIYSLIESTKNKKRAINNAHQLLERIGVQIAKTSSSLLSTLLLTPL
ncbi:MAG: glycerate kinase [candidate division WOR-3 bacterium]